MRARTYCGCYGRDPCHCTGRETHACGVHVGNHDLPPCSGEGVGIFYREAGPKDAPTIVLLHGFPSSSRQFDRIFLCWLHTII